MPASYEFLLEFCIDNVTVSETEITTLLLHSDDSCSMGADNISSFIFVSVQLFYLQQFNNSFNGLPKNCTWPSLGKISYITPLHKTGPLNLIENYSNKYFMKNFRWYSNVFCLIVFIQW